MAAFTFLAAKRTDRKHHAQLSLLQLSQSGDEKAIKKQFEDWEKEA